MDVTYAGRYSELHARHWWWRAREALVLAELQRLAPRSGGRRILDVGCGAGLLFPRLEAFGEVEGVEPDPAMRAGAHDARIHAGPFETFHPGQHYSVILMLDVLEHVPDAVGFLKHALALLEADGTLLVTVPAFLMLWTSHDVLNQHRTRYTKRSFRRLARQAGMRVERMAYFFHWLFVAKLAVRLYEAVARPQPAPPRLPAPWINRAAYLVSRAEQAALGRVRFPWGSSLMVVASRPASA